MSRFSAENLTLPKDVTIVEVGPRDGLQNEHAVSTDIKVALINALSQTGLTRIEAGAFVSAKRVPQMADSLAVFDQIHRNLGVQYSALTPNLQGFQAAVSAQVDHVAIFASCSEGFSQHNIHCSIAESLARFQPVVTQAKQLNIPCGVIFLPSLIALTMAQPRPAKWLRLLLRYISWAALRSHLAIPLAQARHVKSPPCSMQS